MKKPIVVKIKTEHYVRGNSVCQTKSLTVLKRKSGECADLIQEDISNVGVEDFLLSVTNFDSCKDGIYELVFTAVGRDWETGYVDDYAYTLIPYE